MALKYLITGGSGNLGCNVINELLAKGADVRALVMPGDSTAERLPAAVERCAGDVLDRLALERFFQAPDGTELVVIHCAGIVTIYPEFQQKVFDVNVRGVKNVVDMCVRFGVKKLVHVASVHAITEAPRGFQMSEPDSFDPASIVGFYGKTKAQGAQIVMDAVKKQGLNASIVFPSGICGPNDYAVGHVTQLIIDCARGRLPAGIRGGYDFVDARDVARGIVACAERGGVGENYILSNRYVPVREILQLVHRCTGAREVKLMLPVWTAKLALPFFKLGYRIRKQKPLFTSYSIYTLMSNSNFSHAKATRELGYEPRPFQETVADTAQWLGGENRLRRPAPKRRRRKLPAGA